MAYDAQWPASFRAERERLAAFLPGACVHHIGSTSVRGLAAKPVIDMIALVEDLDASAEVVVRRGGYWMPLRFNRNLAHRRYLCYPSVSFRTHHLHLVDRHEDMEACLCFREILRAEPKLALEYAALKQHLASRFRADRESYTEAKTAFIRRAVANAPRARPLSA